MWIYVPSHLLNFDCFEFDKEDFSDYQVLSHLGSPSFKFLCYLVDYQFWITKNMEFGSLSLLAKWCLSMKASYSALLFVVGKFRLRQSSKIALLGLFRTNPASTPTPGLLFALSTNIFNDEEGSIWGGSMSTLGTPVVSSTMVTYTRWGGFLITLCPSSVDLFSTDFVAELSSSLCADAWQPSSWLIIWGENSAIKLAKTCPFIITLNKKIKSNYLSSMAHLESCLDWSALDKIFFYQKLSIYSDGMCLEIMHEFLWS